MPVQYRGVIEEHRATREHAGLFDVSHMGEFSIRGQDAAALLDRVVPSRISTLPIGKVIYTVMTLPNGAIVDDLLIYRMGDAEFMAVVNASNRAKDWQWLMTQARGYTVQLEDRSDVTALIAIQGPAAREITARIASGFDPFKVKYYHWSRGALAGRPVFASRTGYTGEIGFEIFLDNQDAPAVWDALLAAGRADGLVPCGLAARDTLRLEAGLPLYGNDIDDTTSVLSAMLEFTIDWSKDEFIGKPALVAERESGSARKRIGFVLRAAGVPRQHNPVLHRELAVGEVTSGTFAPSFGAGLGMAYVDAAVATPGTALAIDVRGRQIPAEIVPLPFYRRSAGKERA